MKNTCGGLNIFRVIWKLCVEFEIHVAYWSVLCFEMMKEYQ
jgi:hypothetical protein